MRMSQVRRLHSGDEVTWNDPDEGRCSRTGTILEIIIKGDIVCITWSDGSTTECFARELS